MPHVARRGSDRITFATRSRVTPTHVREINRWIATYGTDLHGGGPAMYGRVLGAWAPITRVRGSSRKHGRGLQARLPDGAWWKITGAALRSVPMQFYGGPSRKLYDLRRLKGPFPGVFVWAQSLTPMSPAERRRMAKRAAA